MALTGMEPVSTANLKAALDKIPDPFVPANVIAVRASGTGTKEISDGSGKANVPLSMSVSGGMSASGGIITVPVYGLYYITVTAAIALEGTASRKPEAAVTLFTPSGSVEFAHATVGSSFMGGGSSSGSYSYSTIEPMNAGGQIRLYAELWGDTVDAGREATFTCTMTVQRVL